MYVRNTNIEEKNLAFPQGHAKGRQTLKKEIENVYLDQRTTPCTELKGQL